jgi:hypothetical protein
MSTKATDRPNSDYIHPQNHDYYAWICMDKEELDLPIPSNFPFSEGKTWRDYSTHTIDPTGLDFIHVGYRDKNGNRKERITEAEFQCWRDHFKGRNIWNVTEAKEYMKQFQGDEE